MICSKLDHWIDHLIALAIAADNSTLARYYARVRGTPRGRAELLAEQRDWEARGYRCPHVAGAAEPLAPESTP